MKPAKAGFFYINNKYANVVVAKAKRKLKAKILA